MLGETGESIFPVLVGDTLAVLSHKKNARAPTPRNRNYCIEYSHQAHFTELWPLQTSKLQGARVIGGSSAVFVKAVKASMMHRTSGTCAMGHFWEGFDDAYRVLNG